MPDLLTHYASARAAGLLLKKEEDRLTLALGVFIPDVASFLIRTVFQGNFYYSTLSHSLIGALLYSIIIGSFFARIKAFFLIFLGMLLHIFLDLFKHHHGHGACPLLFPFDHKFHEIGLYSPTDIIYIIPFSLAAIFLLEVYYVKQQRLAS